MTSSLLHELEPTIKGAYDHHMNHQGPREPLYPPSILAEVAGVEERDPLVYAPILRENHERFLKDFVEKYGVDIRPVLASSFFINLLTEDNLPYYTEINLSQAKGSDILTEWVREWTAEEDGHGTLMRDYALFTGLIGDRQMSVISHDDYFAGRSQQLRSGSEIDPPNLYRTFAYVTLQELLTREAHKSLGWLLDKESGEPVMREIGNDENRHYLFYRTLSKAALELHPDETLRNMAEVYRRKAFAMPGRIGIPNFDAHSSVVGLAGIFDKETIVRNQRAVVTRLKVEDATPETDEGAKAQEEILHATSDEAIAREHKLMEYLRDMQLRNAPDGDVRPFILGRTVKFERTIDPVTRKPNQVLVPIAA